jgi:mono/diheme cytochrome c family protein
VNRTKQTQEKLKMKTQGLMKLACGMTIAAAFAFPVPADPSADAGKAIYNNSCIHCHGAGGAGNPVQDTFWQIAIPRLNGDYVQKKSDDQLRTVILNGIRKMPPAVLGRPHQTIGVKVTPEQVPDLIAYIRSLKKLKKK